MFTHLQSKVSVRAFSFNHVYFNLKFILSSLANEF
jgi:hypothetical protein